MRIAAAAAAIVLTAGGAAAQEVTIEPSVDARLRYEHFDQSDLPREADALTLRVRPGLTAKSGRWSALVEGEAVVALVDRYDDGLNGRAGYPLIPDPENVELNRLQLRYAAPALVATGGRQRISLADDRFVGPSPWRQNEQSFDAARLQLGSERGPRLDVSYIWSVRTVNGRRGFGARPTSIGGDNMFALASIGGPTATLTGFVYLIDQDDAAVQGFRLSSQTWGLRGTGKLPIARDLTLAWSATAARQSDWARNPNDYAATYALGEAMLARGGWTAGGGGERLGADDGTPLTSVQAPLGAAFRFDGWAGRFSPTPPDGLRDYYARVERGWRKVGGFDTIALTAVAHHFTSDRQVRPYGDELDLLASARRGAFQFSARWAHYQADGFATDTERFWLQVDFSR